MKSLALALVTIGNSISPVVSEQELMRKVDHVSSIYENKIITNNYFENLSNFLKNNENEYKNLTNEFYEIASNNEIINSKTKEKLINFENMIINNFNNKNARS